MKMQSFRRGRRPLSPAFTLAVIAAVALTLIALLLRFVFPGAFTALTTPLYTLGSTVSAAFYGNDALSMRVKELTLENETLKTKNAALSARLGEEETGIVASVIARPPLSPYDVLVIDSGTKENIFDGMRVYARGVPIGLVESASGGSAKVLLYSAPGVATEGWVGETRLSLTLYGAGSGAYRADVPREAGVLVGDAVYLPGGADPIGTVVAVESHPSAPRAALSIRPVVNIFSLTVVSVLPNPAP